MEMQLTDGGIYLQIPSSLEHPSPSPLWGESPVQGNHQGAGSPSICAIMQLWGWPQWTHTNVGLGPLRIEAIVGLGPLWSYATVGRGPLWSSATVGLGPLWSNATVGQSPPWQCHGVAMLCRVYLDAGSRLYPLACPAV